jgi:hypothetical protein
MAAARIAKEKYTGFGNDSQGVYKRYLERRSGGFCGRLDARETRLAPKVRSRHPGKGIPRPAEISY